MSSEKDNCSGSVGIFDEEEQLKREEERLERMVRRKGFDPEEEKRTKEEQELAERMRIKVEQRLKEAEERKRIQQKNKEEEEKRLAEEAAYAYTHLQRDAVDEEKRKAAAATISKFFI